MASRPWCLAGLGSTPYAAFHFHRVTPYGVLANLAAMPVVSALATPATARAARHALRLRGVFWQVMGIGIDWMIVITKWVANLPGAIGRVTAFGTGPLLAATLGIILMGLLRTPLRWSGAGVSMLALAWAIAYRSPTF